LHVQRGRAAHRPIRALDILLRKETALKGDTR
jgi:hypothetical protein